MAIRRGAVRGEDGSVGPLFAAVLLALAAALAAASVFVGRSLDYGRRSEAASALRRQLTDTIAETIAELGADPTPDSDGPRDPVWSRLGRRPDGIAVELADLSSRANANFVSAEFLGGTELRDQLAPGASPAALAAFRCEEGLATELGHYRDFLGEDSAGSWTCFGWANANTADPASLKSLYRSLVGSEDAAEAFSLRVAAARSAKRAIVADTLKELLGGSYPEAWPAINVAASHNANFAPPALLRAVVAYAPFGIPEPAAKAGALIAARESADLAAGELASILGVDATNGVFQYLGTRTYFWSLTARRAGVSCRAVAAVRPEEGRGLERKIEIVETRFEP